MKTHLNAIQVMCAGVASLILTAGLARFAYTPLLPLMQSQAHLSQVAGGWLAAVNYMGYMTGVLIAMWVCQPRLKFILYRVGLVLAIVTTAATGLTADIYLWSILRFVSGLSTAAGMLIGSGLVLNWLMHHGRRPELGIHFAGMGIGIAVSGAAVLLMTQYLDWSQQWLVLGILGLILLLPAWAWLPAPSAPLPQNHVKSGVHPAPSKIWLTMLMSAYFCAGYGYVVSATFIVSMAEKLPTLANRGSVVWIIVGIAAIPACFIWDHIARKFGDARALLMAYALQTVSILLPCIAQNLGVWLLSSALYGATFIGIVSLTLALAGRHFPGNSSKAMAKLTLGYGVAQILAPTLSAYLSHATGNYQSTLWLTACVMAVGTVIVRLIAVYETRQLAGRRCTQYSPM
jgi:MFS family permease